MSCSIQVKSNTIELTVHTSCYWVLDLLCVKCYKFYWTLSMYMNLKWWNLISDLLPEGFLNADCDKHIPRRFLGIRCHPHIQTSLHYLNQTTEIFIFDFKRNFCPLHGYRSTIKVWTLFKIMNRSKLIAILNM